MEYFGSGRTGVGGDHWLEWCVGISRFFLSWDPLGAGAETWANLCRAFWIASLNDALGE